MATTRKRKLNEECFDHGCIQREELGEIKARLDGQESTDLRIEAAVQQLINNHDAEKKATYKEFSELKCEITRVGTALEASAKNSEQLIQNQTAMIEQMKNISATTAAMKESQDNTQKMFEKHIHESDAWRANIERRIGKLERTKWFWYTLSGILVALAGLLSYVASIYDVVVKK